MSLQDLVAEWDRIDIEEARLLAAWQEARERLESFRSTQLKPGEIRRGLSRVMIRYSRRQQYKEAIVSTPCLRPRSLRLVFSNNKTAKIIEILLQENPRYSGPFLWITLEKPRVQKRDL